MCGELPFENLYFRVSVRMCIGLGCTTVGFRRSVIYSEVMPVSMHSHVRVRRVGKLTLKNFNC